MKTLTALLAVLVTALLAFFPFLPMALPPNAEPAATAAPLRSALPTLPAGLRTAHTGTDTIAEPPQTCTLLPVNAQVPKAFLPFVLFLGMNRLVRLRRGVLRRNTARICPLVLRCFRDHPHHAPPALA